MTTSQMQKARATWARCWQVLWSENASLYIAARFYQALFRTFFYGSKSWIHFRTWMVRLIGDVLKKELTNAGWVSKSKRESNTMPLMVVGAAHESKSPRCNWIRQLDPGLRLLFFVRRGVRRVGTQRWSLCCVGLCLVRSCFFLPTTTIVVVFLTPYHYSSPLTVFRIMWDAMDIT